MYLCNPQWWILSINLAVLMPERQKRWEVNAKVTNAVAGCAVEKQKSILSLGPLISTLFVDAALFLLIFPISLLWPTFQPDNNRSCNRISSMPLKMCKSDL